MVAKSSTAFATKARAVAALVKQARPEVVFHLAAKALVRTAYDFPHETFETNVMGTINVLEAIRKMVHVTTGVIVTTDKCYENHDLDVAFKESDPLGGKDPYAASKACAEIAFLAYSRSFFHHGSALGQLASARAGSQCQAGG